MGYFLWGSICAGICYLLAKKKKRNPVLWASLGFFLSLIGGFFFSLIGVVIIAILPTEENGKTLTWLEEISSIFSASKNRQTVTWLEEIPSIQYKHYHNKTGVAMDTTNKVVYLLEKKQEKSYP